MKRIAIIGSGISGLTCAYLLDRRYDVTVFEKNHYIGGHTATVDIEYEGRKYAIDTGFIVFNDRTYPGFNRLLSELRVKKQPTEMSFSVHHHLTGFEYNGNNLNSLFAQRRNLLRPTFWELIKDILRFNKLCKQIYHEGNTDTGITLGDFLNQNGFGSFFSQHYILPMGAAIWSTSLDDMEQFELSFFIRFFYNHGLLDVANRPQWFVIPGGSRTYVNKLLTHLKHPVHTHAQIETVIRHGDRVEVLMADGTSHLFDEVIFACHSDQALALLKEPTADENSVLGAIPYSRNEVILHTDTALLPKRKLAWASWNYRLDDDPAHPACVTYNMNILQGLASDTTFCVTLNQSDAIKPEKVLRSFIYHHPVLNSTSMEAQNKRSLICGKNRTHFVGAYWYNGFHEDGVRSALDVTNRFGETL